MSRIRRACASALLVTLALAGGCGRPSGPPPGAVAADPAAAVLRLIDDLRRNDLTGYARHCVPPALHRQLQAAWREGRTRWPLSELPLHERLPGLLTTLSAADADRALLATYDRQFAGAHAELRSTAATLGLFATQYLKREGDYSEQERAHYGQLVAALSRWGQRAPLGDSRRAHRAIPQLVSAARLTGLAGGPERFAALGMERSLGRLGPFFARFKQVLGGYGLDLDASLAGATATVTRAEGDRASVRLAYTVAGQPIGADIDLERIDGQWYLSDALRHARAAAAGAPSASPASSARPAPAPPARPAVASATPG